MNHYGNSQHQNSEEPSISTNQIRQQLQDHIAFSDMEKEFGKLQIASVMMNPNNGEVLALVGGKDYNTSQFNRAISAKRQVGSTMKPFLYYAALESGFTSASSFISEKTTFSFSSMYIQVPEPPPSATNLIPKT